jgi:hypothetical protein
MNISPVTNNNNKKFKMSDINIYLTKFIDKNDVYNFMLTNKDINTDLYYLPYKTFKFKWYSGSDTIRTFLSHIGGIEKLIVDGYHFFTYIAVAIPRLKSVTLVDFNIVNWDFLYLCKSSLEEITFDSVNIHSSVSRLDCRLFPHLKRIKINSQYEPLKCICSDSSNVESKILESSGKKICIEILL